MAQLTVYVDEKTRKKIASAARRANMSVSSWVKQKLTQAIDNEWPEGYFEVLGSLADDDLERPGQGSFADDSPREPL